MIILEHNQLSHGHDTDTGHRNIRQPERRRRQDDALRDIRQLPGDKGKARARNRLRHPAVRGQVPQGRHPQIWRGTHPIRCAGIRCGRQASHDRPDGKAAQRAGHGRGTHGFSRQPKGGRTDSHVRQLGHHHRAVPLRPGDGSLHRQFPHVHRPSAQGRRRTDEGEVLHRSQPE